MGISNNLYNLALILLGGSIITLVVIVFYIIGIIRYAKKQRILIKELAQIEINNMNYKENI
ncbi:hypothetical protein DIC82_18115 [Clostridium beijerinckii]|nr:hypothetical protein DIC82_18115 [Clostridium beijerinckii]